jgi:alanyl-tRNA synthetase
MTSAQIRQSFLDFFREKKHTIVPSSPLLPDSPNLLFTNAGMNQFVPIFLGQQKPSWNPPRVADTQKCIRAGGKHNDLEDVGLDTYHHTFFEMLGNWSFGDYFKREAIEWAWELVVDRWKFPAQRLYATVYKPGPDEPSEFDQEAHDHWARLFQDADLDPKIHVVSFGKADNFWMMGDTGPCGPCSELHVDLTPDGDTRGALVNKNDPRCFEIWNLVFIQFNANPDGTFAPLPQRHVDTGMGFERVTAIIQGTRNLTDFSGTISNYETDIFRPIFDQLEELSGKKYGSTIPKHGSAGENEQEKIDIAFRVIADHIRALSFAIADGIIPSNEGRGYVLRRILRRAVSYGRDLGIEVQFLFKLVDIVVNTMSVVFPELQEQAETIRSTIRKEEDLFNRTVERGFLEWHDLMVDIASDILKAFARENPLSVMDFVELTNLDALNRAIIKELAPEANSLEKLVHRLRGRVDFPDQPLGGPNVWLKVRSDRELSNAEIRQLKTISGAEAFKLYDTYGFPLDLTQLKARELDLSVDVQGFEKLMEQQRSRSRGAQKKETIGVTSVQPLWGPTKFVGYDHLIAEGGRFVLEGDELYVEISPFYAEMGGQVGDTGFVESTDGKQTAVLNTVRTSGSVHVLRIEDPEIFGPGAGVPFRQVVDTHRRQLIQGHHTVTHLLHWALHKVVSRDAAQKGSYVGPDKLTFDFSSAALTPQQKRDVEKLVNEKIAENAIVSTKVIPYSEAKDREDIQQFFGEKYGKEVRVVQVGGSADSKGDAQLNGYSMELCGGTHVRSTSEIGAFRIVKEEAIAAGTRRIEAVAGDAARVWAREEAARQQERFEALSRKKTDLAPLPVFTDTVQTDEMLKQIDARSAQLEKLDVDVRDWEKKHAKEAEADLRSRAAQIANDLASSKIGQKICVTSVPDADAKLLQAVADALKQKFDGPIVLAGAKGGNVALVAVVPKALTSKFQANKIIQQLAPIVGGKGGGRPESAQGGGTDADKIDKALAEAKRLLT